MFLFEIVKNKFNINIVLKTSIWLSDQALDY